MDEKLTYFSQSNFPSIHGLLLKEYTVAREALELYIADATKGHIVRSRLQEYEEGEKSTNNFFNLEKYRAETKTIREIYGPKGKLVTDQKEILEAQA